MKEVVDAKGGKAKLSKGTMYKFLIVADTGAAPAKVSKTIHVATAGKKGVSNYAKVTVGKKALSKAKKMKVGKTLKLKAKAVKKKGAKVKAHVKLRYESSNASVAVVGKSGKVEARGKGTCFVYAFAQNGVSKKVKVKVR